MGVYISLHASNKVNPAQWEKAYEETLILVDKFNFIEIQKLKKFNQEYFAAVQSKEREDSDGIGWRTNGEGVYMATAEDFFLPRKIDKPNQNDKYCDPLMYILAQNGIIDFESPYIRKLSILWDSKTQGQPYHTGLLAIACLLDDRLNGDVVCGSDITYGQCKHAVEIVNKILKKKIGMPLRCRIEDLYKRVRQLPIEKEQMLDAFAVTYLGIKDEQYYKFVEEHFSDEEQYSFFKEKMNCRNLGTISFANCLQEILSYNIPITKVCSLFLETPPEKRRLEKEDPFKYFIELILETNIHLPEKDMRNCLKVDESTAETMCIEKLFASFLLMGARNRSVARYIPLDNLKAQLVEALGNKCDVCKIIDNYLEKQGKKKEKRACTILNDAHDAVNKKIEEEQEKYDIARTEDYIFFANGDSIAPSILKIIKKTVKFYKDTLDEPRFAELMQADYKERCRYLEMQNRYIKLMNFTWNKIFDDIRDNPESFKRYYPMVRIEVNKSNTHDFIRAYVANDYFYEMCQKL